MQHSLNTMIRLAKFQLDEKKTKLASLKESAEMLEANMAQIERDITAEGLAVDKDPSLAQTFPAWVETARARKAVMAESLDLISDQIDQVNEEMMDLFSELKRYELTLDDLASKSQTRHNRRQTDSLDELAIQRFRHSGG